MLGMIPYLKLWLFGIRIIEDNKLKNMFGDNFPYLAAWVETIGWIEMGENEMTNSLLRILNEGGTVWSDEESGSIEEALIHGEEYLKSDFPEEFGYDVIEPD